MYWVDPTILKFSHEKHDSQSFLKGDKHKLHRYWRGNSLNLLSVWEVGQVGVIDLSTLVHIDKFGVYVFRLFNFSSIFSLNFPIHSYKSG